MSEKISRDALVARNQQLIDAYHQTPVQHRIRRYLTQLFAHFPFAPLNTRADRILFIRPDHIGDMLLAMPAIRLLKATRPRTEVHVLAGPWSAKMLENMPEVDQVLTINFPGFDRDAKKTSPWQPYIYLLRISRQLRKIGYHTAIVMRPDHWWGAMLAHVAGIKRRIGYKLPDVTPFLTDVLEHQREHAVRQNVRLIGEWTGTISDDGIPFYYQVTAESDQFMVEYLTGHQLDSTGKLICIHPGAGAWAKRWSDAQWGTTADMLLDQHPEAAILFTGTDHERAAIEQITGQMRHTAINTAGDLTIDQLAALYKQASIALGPDSGPMHLAAALDTPTITLFGPADPLEYRPWGKPQEHIVLTSNIACRPCRVLDWGDDDPEYHPCVRDIQPWQVVQAAQRTLNP
jgi:lipopolysaccharide heptosyltransferase II